MNPTNPKSKDRKPAVIITTGILIGIVIAYQEVVISALKMALNRC